jgi:glucose-6-phosphate dehydrogenase assembly protein OpcA
MLRGARIRDVERELARLRAEQAAVGGSAQRTSVMTHLAWVPERWQDAATKALAGLEERHPSRTILLFPRPDDSSDALDASVDLRCFAGGGESAAVCFEVVELHLLGARARHPASVVVPLLLPDLPVFLRWRGDPPFGASELDELAGVADRLVVDSSEWEDVPGCFGRLAQLFDRIAVSDIAWSRTEPWRRALAARWPGIADVGELRVEGPEADALLLAGWLRARLGRDVSLEWESAPAFAAVALDGEVVELRRADLRSPSDLLSDQLEVFGRDPIYEEAVRSFSAVPT